MNPKLLSLFNLYRNLRTMQSIVEEIITLDYFVTHFDKDKAAIFLDYCINKYEKDIKKIGALYKNKVVIDQEGIYDTKDEPEVNSDCEYVRDCLIIIGAVKSGMRPSLDAVVEEIES